MEEETSRKTRSSVTSLRELPPEPSTRTSNNNDKAAFSGFKNPLFVGEKDSSIASTKVEYAKVNKKRPTPQQQQQQHDHKSQNGTLNPNSSLGFYEEIPHDHNPTTNNTSGMRDSNQNDIPYDKDIRIRSPNDDGVYSEIDQPETIKTNRNKEKKKLDRIASAKGSFHDLKFDTTTPINERLAGNGSDGNNKVPIYHNSSIPTTPITTLGDLTNLTTSPNIYEDAPRSNAMDSLPNNNQQDQIYQQPVVQPHSTDSIYNVPPSSPISETYDLVPQQQNRKRNTRSCSIYANFRRPVPAEISLKRLPFTLRNHNNARDPNAKNHASPAFYLLLANHYLQQTNNNDRGETEMEDELLAKARILMRTAEDMWSGLDDNGVGTSVDEAGYILKSALRKDDIAFKMGEEKSWNTDEQIGGISPYDALYSIYNNCIESTKKSCLVLTFSQGKICICLFDGHGNQTFLDYNIHFKNNKQSTVEAIEDPECGGVVVKCSKRNSDSMLNFILTNMCLEMKADARCGNAVPMYHKHHYLGETSPPQDFI